jgi:hypothetical protein
MAYVQTGALKVPSKDLIFIDANQYLDLFRMVQGHKLLRPLKAVKKHIFVPRQIPMEVRRRKVEVACEFLTRQLTMGRPSKIGLPTQLFGESDERVRQLDGDLNGIVKSIDVLNSRLANLAHDVLGQISRSEDEVSIALDKIFARSVSPTESQVQNAELRKKFGSPPGKQRDPLGDELNWEQIMSECHSVRRLWLITRDSDYAVDYRGKSYLNSLLHWELKTLTHPIETFCFKDMYDGLRHFSETANVSIKQLPTAEEAEEIKEEQASLPAFVGTHDWSNAAATAARSGYRYQFVSSVYPTGMQVLLNNPGFAVPQPDYMGQPPSPTGTSIGSVRTHIDDYESKTKPPGESSS